ncbi:MAG: pirin family protein [Deltaproteobacteria bacterium]|nr:pirin family protein [Nannocystaceae bacterium]
MTNPALATRPDRLTHSGAHRGIAFRTKGHTHGPITRLMSPGDVGELAKPFVFLDYFETTGFQGRGFPAHPHSGIATHTTLIQGTFDYGDSTGKSGTLYGGNLEWMQAGGGVWHWGDPRPSQPVRGYQLWIALPAELENEPAQSHYIDTAQVQVDRNVRVLLGSYGELRSPIPYHEPVTYLHVTLEDGERWTFEPDPEHDIAWLAVNRGGLRTAGVQLSGEMVVFEEGHGEIMLEAIGATELVIASARKHPHPLVCGSYSVHTSPAALVRGEQGINEVARTPQVREAVRRTSR